MPTEVWPLIRNWQRRTGQHNGRKFRFYESAEAVLLPGGIGHAAGTRPAAPEPVRLARGRVPDGPFCRVGSYSPALVAEDRAPEAHQRSGGAGAYWRPEFHNSEQSSGWTRYDFWKRSYINGNQHS